MIWGLTLEPGKQYTRVMGGEIQLSMASLESRGDFGVSHDEYCHVILRTTKCEYLLCTLVHGMTFQQNLDLKLKPMESVTFSVEGTSVVYLMGYSESDSEEDEQIEVGTDLPVKEVNIDEHFSDDPETSISDPDDEAMKEEISVLADTSVSITKSQQLTEDIPMLPSPSQEPVTVTETTTGYIYPHSSSDLETISAENNEQTPEYIHLTHNDYNPTTVNQERDTQDFPSSEILPIKQEIEDVSDVNMTMNKTSQINQEMPHGQDHLSQAGPQKHKMDQREQLLMHQRDLHIPQGDSQIGPSGLADEVVPMSLDMAHVSMTSNHPLSRSDPQNIWPGGTLSRHPEEPQQSHSENELGTSQTTDAQYRPPGTSTRHIEGAAPSQRRNWKMELNTKRQKKQLPDLSNEDSAFQCIHCKVTFPTLVLQITHMKTFHRLLLTCPYCGLQSSSMGQLKIHLRSHTGEKPYQCSICGKPFSRLQNKNRHERTHSGARPYSCRFCNRTFTQDHHRKKHEMCHL